VGLQVGGIDHHGLRLAEFGCQTGHHLHEDTLVALSFPTVLERLVRAAGGVGIAPPQAIAIDRDNPAENVPVIDAPLAVGRQQEGLQTHHLRIRRPEKIAYVTARFSNRESRPHREINAV
jgi:hypothetical protein